MDRVTKIIELRQQGRTYAEIGVELGISKQRVYQLCGSVDKVIKCAYCNKPGKRMYCNDSCMYLARRKKCISCDNLIGSRSERCVTCDKKRLEAIDTDTVVKLYNGGVSGRNIAKYFGVTTRIVFKRLSGTKLRRGYTERGDYQVELIVELLNG